MDVTEDCGGAEAESSIELQSRSRTCVQQSLPRDSHQETSLQAGPAPNITRRPSNLSIRYLFPKAKMWWSHSVRLTIKYPSGNGNPRDYLALERTYLAYIRTSSAIVSLGVVIVQLFILKNVSKTTGVVLGATLSGGGIIVAMVGCFRFFRQQEHMNKGKAICAGLDMLAVWAILVLISLTLFIVVLVED